MYNENETPEPIINKWFFSFGENATQLVLPSFYPKLKAHKLSNFTHNHTFLCYYDFKGKTY